MSENMSQDAPSAGISSRSIHLAANLKLREMVKHKLPQDELRIDIKASLIRVPFICIGWVGTQVYRSVSLRSLKT